MSAHTTPIQLRTRGPNPCNMARKGRRHTDWKGRNTSLTDDMIIDVDNPKESTNRPLE